MKTKHLTRILGLGFCLLAGTALAQNPVPATPTRSTDNDTSLTSRAAHHSQQFCRSKDLVGADVKDTQGQKVGEIKELVLNPQNGQAFAAIGIGKGRDALVPLGVLTVTPPRSALRNAEVTLSKTKAELEAGPLISNNEWHQLDDAAFTQKIYSHYNVQAPMASGGTGTQNGISTGRSNPSDPLTAPQKP